MHALIHALDRPPTRGRGRPLASASPAERIMHLGCLYRRSVLRMPLRTVAFDMRVSESTAKRWISRAKFYREGETREALIRFLSGIA